MDQLFDFLHSLGGLHDAIVISINWKIESNTLEVILDDLYANFRGFPEYPGRQSGVIQFQGTSKVDFNVDSSERLKIFEILLMEGCANEVIAKFSPSGTLSIRFASATYPTNALKDTPRDITTN